MVILVILVLKRLPQENYEFEASLDYVMRPLSQTNEQTNKQNKETIRWKNRLTQRDVIVDHSMVSPKGYVLNPWSYHQ